MGQKKQRSRGSAAKRAADKEFGLLPIPPEVNPVGSSRGPTTEIMWLPCVPNPVNCSTTSIASVFAFTGASIQSFSDYAANWEEYVVRAIHFRLRSTGTQIGVLKFYVDEADNSTPTSTAAAKHVGWLMRCQAASGDFHSSKWVAKDTTDEAWVATSNTSKFLVALKCYSNTASYGLVGTTEQVAHLDAIACVQFRTQGGA